MARRQVVVVGGGNAGLCSALAALEGDAEVTLLEAAPRRERGGNSGFTAGAMRVAYDGIEDILQLVPDLSEREREKTDFGQYSRDKFFDDMARVTQYRCDPELTDLLVSRSFDTLKWMRGKGVRFLPIYGRQAFEVNGKFTFWGGLTLEVSGGGRGLMDRLYTRAEAAGVEFRYSTQITRLLAEGGRVYAVEVVGPDGRHSRITGDAFVAALGS
ncbi:MAG: FAD-dependent oxidoreductase, partial [Actinomycetes bacterium]